MVSVGHGTGALLSRPEQAAPGPWRINTPLESPSLVRFAAREVRRYFYLRTGILLPIESADHRSGIMEPVILVAARGQDFGRALGQRPGAVEKIRSLKKQEYWIHTFPDPRRPLVLLCGGSPVSTLYAAYRFAEDLGVRFYLHGDVIPDQRLLTPPSFPRLAKGAEQLSNGLHRERSFRLSVPDEWGRPRFVLRGILPFHDFPEGPDWWSRANYLALIGQLPKLRLNFIGLHTYPEGNPNAEPTVWIGLPQDVGHQGRVRFGYPANYFNTAKDNWGYEPRLTEGYSFGAAEPFAANVYGGPVMGGLCPEPRSPTDRKLLFDRTAELLREAFRFAHRLGVQTCVGTETPLTIPKRLSARLRKLGLDPKSLKTRKELYEGIFGRLMRAYPLDYYWLWTTEQWTWKGTDAKAIEATTNDIAMALAAARQVRAPFRLATCGWMLGPPEDRLLFDETLPRSVALSCLNRDVGDAPVDSAFAMVKHHEKWAIPWLEDDPGLTLPQLWVGRTLEDAAEAARLGCEGIIGIHWRTRIVGPNVSALAQAAWRPEDWPNKRDFYTSWAAHQFGDTAATPIAAIFSSEDGVLPRPAFWYHGPGALRPDSRPWSRVKPDYAFVGKLAALAPRIHGAGNRERFGYWLHRFEYLRTMAHLACTWALYTNAVARAEAASGPARQRVAAQEALPLRVRMVHLTSRVYRLFLFTFSTTGDLGTLVNWEEHILPQMLDKPGKKLAHLLCHKLPSDAEPSADYTGPLRIAPRAVRTSFNPGERLRLRVWILSDSPVEQAMLYWRRMGRGSFRGLPLQHLARGVYWVDFPASASRRKALEYYIRARNRKGRTAVFPATAPILDQTLVALPR